MLKKPTDPIKDIAIGKDLPASGTLEPIIGQKLYFLYLPLLIPGTEPTDHSIEKDLMHVIWARGQESGEYNHYPKSGIEKENAQVKDFYKADELKYHGHGSQRGQLTLNFYGW